MGPQTRKNPILKYVMKDDKKEDIFHSSAYGVSQNGQGMGVASTESFAARQQINNNRQFVQGFKDSGMVRSMPGAPRAKTYEPPKQTTPMVSNRQSQPARQSMPLNSPSIHR